jgi:hypothetical protein
MKLLVFAHVPPPHHGQSYMVQLMLNGFGGDCAQIGRQPLVRRNPTASSVITSTRAFPKRWRTSANSRAANFSDFFYCLQAIWCRFRYGVTNFYYVPAPGKPSRFTATGWSCSSAVRFSKNHFALARRRAGQMAGNRRPNPHRGRHLPARSNKPDSASSSPITTSPTRKNFCPGASRRQQRHSRSVPGFQTEIHFAAAPARFAARAKLFANEPLRPGISKRPAAIHKW